MSGGSPETDLDLPEGFTYASVHCGIKRSGKRDLTLVVADRPVIAAGVYTQNLICAAPVLLDRQRTPSDSVRGVIINSGNANACTGERGLRDAHEMTALTAAEIGCDARQVLVMSTGVIGVPLEMPKIRSGIGAAMSSLAPGGAAFMQAAEGILTTDTCTKVASRSVEVAGERRSVVAMAKGSGMIAPNMATMLALVLTDAVLPATVAQSMLQRIAATTFNRITVDGHTSTNDTLLLLARPPAAAIESAAADGTLERVEQAVHEVCSELARAIVDDGEGATRRMEIAVTGCRTEEEASRIAFTVANSPLVKTAIAGADPNWGRIVSAAGYAGVPFDPQTVRFHLNGFLLFEHGMPVPFEEAKVSQSMRDNRVISIELAFQEGESTAQIQSSDLTAEYVRINADYRT